GLLRRREGGGVEPVRAPALLVGARDEAGAWPPPTGPCSSCGGPSPRRRDRSARAPAPSRSAGSRPPRRGRSQRPRGGRAGCGPGLGGGDSSFVDPGGVVEVDDEPGGARRVREHGVLSTLQVT